MSDHGTSPEPGTVRFERRLPGPIERVWAFLTESEKRRQWFAGGPMELRPGGAVALTFRNSELSAPGEAVPEKYRKYEGSRLDAQVTRCEPPRLLSFTWSGDSEVTFELTPSGDEVQLLLTHRRIRDAADMADFSGGWHIHLDTLVDLLNGRPRRPFWASFAAIEARYRKPA